MNFEAVVKQLQLESLTAELPLDPQARVAYGYASDLLSDVLAHAPRGSLLVTVQVHLNVIAVAVHAELAGVIFALGRRPDEETRARAVEEGIPLFTSPAPAFEIVGRLYEMGVRGGDV